MPDLFQPRPEPWVDTETVFAADMNRFEVGVEAIDNSLDATIDRVDALESGDVGSTAGKLASGTTGQRPPPTVAAVFYDTTLGQPIFGNGVAWTDAMGEVLTSGGSFGAPQNMTAEVQPDNSIVLSWDAVSGATSYKLYEIRSPDGVDGATELTTTTSTRTPSSMGNYEYWVTASVAGVESASSNHAVCSLPFGSDPDNPGTGDPGGSPAEVLNLGGSGGRWNWGVGYPSGHVDISVSSVEGGWSEAPYGYTTEDGLRVHFQCPMNGGKTSANTKYPRSELREYQSNGTTKAAWSGSSGTHLLSGTTRVIHMEDDKPEMVIAQMHDGSDDTLQIRVEGTTWRASINGTEHATTLGNFAWGVDVNWEIKVDDGTLTIKINGATKITTDPGYGGGQYFKVGCYAQQNSTDQDNPSSGYAACELSNLVCLHS